MIFDFQARVPIGGTAANEETAIVMHLEYRIRLPDHDWVLAQRHRLIPSVYALIKIYTEKFSDPRAVTYSEPTFITIINGKRSSSTALSHAKDFNDLINCSDFNDFNVIITTDGGPNENCRYEKTINCAISHFKKFNMDALFVATNAPGKSAFNRVERRMAPLSRDLAGLVLEA